MKNVMLYLIGHFGVGKWTIAKAICAQSDARLFDNHLVNNGIFSLIRKDGSSPIPPRAWDLIMTVREQALTAMAELAPAEDSFVLTNALFEGDPLDRIVLEQVMDVAGRRGSIFVPVVLTASDEAHTARIPSQDRQERLKMTDAEGAARVRKANRLLDIAHPNRLDLDTTHLAPEAAARTIISHVESLS